LFPYTFHLIFPSPSSFSFIFFILYICHAIHIKRENFLIVFSFLKAGIKYLFSLSLVQCIPLLKNTKRKDTYSHNLGQQKF
jgi:hypothetical protein